MKSEGGGISLKPINIHRVVRLTYTCQQCSEGFYLNSDCHQGIYRHGQTYFARVNHQILKETVTIENPCHGLIIYLPYNIFSNILQNYSISLGKYMRFDFVPFFNPGENIPWNRVVKMMREQTKLAEQADFTTVWLTFLVIPLVATLPA